MNTKYKFADYSVHINHDRISFIVGDQTYDLPAIFTIQEEPVFKKEAGVGERVIICGNVDDGAAVRFSFEKPSQKLFDALAATYGLFLAEKKDLQNIKDAMFEATIWQNHVTQQESAELSLHSSKVVAVERILDKFNLK